MEFRRNWRYMADYSLTGHSIFHFATFFLSFSIQSYFFNVTNNSTSRKIWKNCYRHERSFVSFFCQIKRFSSNVKSLFVSSGENKIEDHSMINNSNSRKYSRALFIAMKSLSMIDSLNYYRLNPIIWIQTRIIWMKSDRCEEELMDYCMIYLSNTYMHICLQEKDICLYLESFIVFLLKQLVR